MKYKCVSGNREARTMSAQTLFCCRLNAKEPEKGGLFLAGGGGEVCVDNLIINGCHDCFSEGTLGRVRLFFPASRPTAKLPRRAAFIRPAARIVRSLKCIAVDLRETARRVLQVTQRDVISNRCQAFICSAGA